MALRFVALGAAMMVVARGCMSPPAATAEAPATPAPLATQVAQVPSAPFTPERVWGEGAAMGTHIAFVGYTRPALDAAAVRRTFDAALAEIQRIEALMTTWRDSELFRVNQSAATAPVAVGQETFDLLAESVRIGALSSGTFDITFESLHGLWKFDHDLDPHPPSDAAIRALLPLLDYRHIRLDPATRTVALTKPGVKVSLGGIAKGYAVDRAVKVLDDAGLTSFFVQAGGDLFARGKKPDGSEWSAGIRDPRGPAPFALIPLSDHAFSTAGDYERAYIVDGKRYHHILDPRTGRPATASRSVTIWAKTALLADEIDDAVFILGPERGLELVEKLDGVGAVIVDAHNHLWISKRLQGLVRLTAAPSDGI